MAGRTTRRAGTGSARQTPRTGQRPRRAAAPKAAGSSRRYVTSLDGLRAVCALGVVFYHMGLAWCTGGLLGVTVLFVLSGYLATSGLLSELERTGTIRLGSYWMRRVKRLLPTCVVFVAITAAVCTVSNHQLLTKMRPDVVPALLMALNWTKIFSHESYFAAAGAPSPLTHFWSLALEFQFYLAWPPILMLLMRAIPQGGGPRWHDRRGVVIVLAVLTLASAALMAALYVPGADPSRAYYGTDTRAQSLLLGCILAFVWPFGEKSQATAAAAAPRRRLALELAGLGSVAALVVMMATAEGYTSFSYYGGILLCSVIAAVAVAALVPAGTVVSRVMSWRPLAWVGSRSFAIYVWHYPVVELMQPRNSTTALAPWQVALELGVILTAAELSYRLVEEPLRKGSLRSYLAALARPILPAAAKGARPSCPRDAASRRPATRGGAGAEKSRTGGLAAAILGAIRRVPRAAVPVIVCAVAAWGLAFVPPIAAVGGEPDAHRVSAATLRKPLSAGKYDVLLIGDSVTLGARDALNEAFPYGMVDAKVGRQAANALDVYRKYSDQGAVGDTVIFAVGTNGALTQDTLQKIYDAVGKKRRLWFVNNRAPEDWVSANNALLKSFGDAHENVGVIDWYGASSGHDEWFWDDGTHLRPQYAQEMANLIVKATGYVKPTRENTTYSAIVLGDATTLEAADELSAAMPQAMIDAAAGRDARATARAWAGYAKAGTAGDVVAIDPDDSAPFDATSVARMIAAVEGSGDGSKGEKDASGSGADASGQAGRVIYLVTCRSTATYCEANNQVLRKAAKAGKSVRLIDWYAASAGHDEYFRSDGVTLTKSGRKAYAKLVSAAVQKGSAAGGSAKSA